MTNMIDKVNVIKAVIRLLNTTTGSMLFCEVDAVVEISVKLLQGIMKEEETIKCPGCNGRGWTMPLGGRCLACSGVGRLKNATSK